jgi:hypothetical protein
MINEAIPDDEQPDGRAAEHPRNDVRAVDGEPSTWMPARDDDVAALVLRRTPP